VGVLHESFEIVHVERLRDHALDPERPRPFDHLGRAMRGHHHHRNRGGGAADIPQ